MTTVNEPNKHFPPAADEHPILFFDGVCGLCNHVVDFVLARDHTGVFRFAPLQGETAREQLSDDDVRNLSSVVLIDKQGIHRRSTAVVRMLWHLQGVWKLAGWLLWLIPRPLRNLGYKGVAVVRYRLFGQKATCRMPTADERARFLA